MSHIVDHHMSLLHHHHWKQLGVVAAAPFPRARPSRTRLLSASGPICLIPNKLLNNSNMNQLPQLSFTTKAAPDAKMPPLLLNGALMQQRQVNAQYTMGIINKTLGTKF